MKVICIGTLDKFSRFFLSLSKELNSKEQTKLYVYSLHASGFLYTLIRLKFSSWVSVKSWFLAIKNKKKYLQIINHDTSYKGIKFRNLINYHLDLNTSVSIETLLLQALAYIDIFELVILKKSPDLMILIGDSKLCIETCVALANKHGIKTYFIEQGPFSTTIFDEKGVNANASIRDFDIKDDVPFGLERNNAIHNFIERPKFPKYSRSPLYRGFDFILDFLLSKSYLYPPDLRFTDTFPSIPISKSVKAKAPLKTDEKTKVFLLILQIPMDVNMIYHSPIFKDHVSIVEAVHKNLPENSRLTLREHPLYRGKYEDALYLYSQKHQIVIETSSSLKDCLKLADVVVVNNSTVGIEAISLNKTVVVLGNAYYDNPKICLKYHQKDDLKQLLSKALGFQPNNGYIESFLHEFCFNYLMPGFITDKELIAAKYISDKIIQKPKPKP